MEEPRSPAPSTSGADSEWRIGSYRVLDSVGVGGMSMVYRAVHVQTGHEVALKVLVGSLSRSSTLLQRFLREARSAETLEHPNIVAIYDRGIDEGRHYLVLEYVPGDDFHGHVQRKGPLSTAEALRVVRGVSSGLRYAAGRGLIHRDIKPSNVLRTPDGEAKIIDLGLALQSEFEDERVTREGTTVGTVDYMSPEQARDSRATSIFSDMYSLGCTFHYLLSGVPPFPGGDITDKLTRHARAAPPDIRTLRPDVPEAVATILARLLAKAPEDRYPNYDRLIEALDAVPLGAGDEGPAAALVPLDDEAPPGDRGIVGDHGSGPLFQRGAGQDGPSEELVPLEPLSEIAPVVAARPAPAAPSPPGRAGPRLEAVIEDEDDVDAGPFDEEGPGPFDEDDVGTGPFDEEEAGWAPAMGDRSFQGQKSAVVWACTGMAVGAAFILLVLGIHAILGRPAGPGPPANAPEAPVAEAEVPVVEPVPPLPPRAEAALDVPLMPPDARPKRARPAQKRAPSDRWVEPKDLGPVPGDDSALARTSSQHSQMLPEWARTPSGGSDEDGPLVVLRRAADPGETTTTLPTLRRALDEVAGGTIEIADQGPLPLDDVRVSGRFRRVRARRGHRPLLRVARTNLSGGRPDSAVLSLEKKDLVLEGIDLIVNVPDLGTKSALFDCLGSSLTLRDCTISIVNPKDEPLVLVRARAAPARAAPARPTRVRLERTLVRGWTGRSSPAFEIASGTADIVLDRSMIVCGSREPKNAGPLFRLARPGPDAEHRLYFLDSVVACPGPAVQRTGAGPDGRGKRLVVRAYGSAFGRLQGPGIASIIVLTDDEGTARGQVDWEGDENQYAGWRGFFARGSEPTILVDGLAGARSTWNAQERGSVEIPAAWPLSPDLAATTPSALAPFLLGAARLLPWAPRPQPGLYEKTVQPYLIPVVPELARADATAAKAPATVGMPPVTIAKPTNGRGSAQRKGEGWTELAFRTDAAPWNGDLGAFLKDRLTAEMKKVRAHVTGSGEHACSAVVLPKGVQLEIQVAPAVAGAPPPSWTSRPEATGPGLFALENGALVLSGVILRLDPSSRLEALISTVDAHLVLDHCQLSASAAAPTGEMGRLVTFRAATTRPMPQGPGPSVFNALVDRPVCRFTDTTLTTGGRGLRAEMGRGLIALSRCGIRAGEAAVELAPSPVSRKRFLADLVMDHTWLASERAVVRLGRWPGAAPGPDRPWIIASSDCAFLGRAGRRAANRPAALLWGEDGAALVSGLLFWQSFNDVYNLDLITAVEGGAPPQNLSRACDAQWANYFIASNRVFRPSGPRSAAAVAAWFRAGAAPRPNR